MLVAALSLLLSAEPCRDELFRIERSKNANVVLYEATRDADAPVKASWLLLATTGAREPLSFFERLAAYGFEVDRGKGLLRLKALHQRALSLVRRGACLVAVGLIDGAEAVLERVYVTTDEHGALPRVVSIELFGVDAHTGAPRAEKLTP